MGNRLWQIQLKDRATKEAITTAGGKVYVALNGDAQKATLYNADGSALANPITPTRGMITFHVVDTVEMVDLYGMAPGGEFFVRRNVKPSGPNELEVDTDRLAHTAVIPFAIADTTANVETATGFKTGTDKLWLPGGIAVKVATVDSGITIDVGTDGAGSNDADGFIDGISAAAAAVVKATNANGAVTLGALLYVQDSANAGDDFPEAFRNAADEDITYTLSAGADTAEGFVYLPYLIAR
jgi:hypothetical protein